MTEREIFPPGAIYMGKVPIRYYVANLAQTYDLPVACQVMLEQLMTDWLMEKEAGQVFDVEALQLCLERTASRMAAPWSGQIKAAVVEVGLADLAVLRALDAYGVVASS